MDDLRAINSLVVAAGFLIGLCLFLWGVYGFKKHTESPQQFTIGMCTGQFLVGCMLMSSSYIYTQAATTLTISVSGSSRSVLSVDNADQASASTGSTFLSDAFTTESKNLIIGFVFLIGVIAFLRGLYLMKDFGSRQNNGSSATAMSLFHVVGGIICMNILYFSCLFAEVFSIPYICGT
jgi:hypothetical protein